MIEPAIDVQAVYKSFRSTEVLRGMTMQVARGRTFAFLGRNASGKTTTIRMLLGLVRPTAGEVHILGLPMPASRREVLARVGAVVEQPTLYPHLTGVENLELKRRLMGAPPSSIHHALEIVGMTAHAGRLVAKYSTGMRQRMGIATALLGSPDLLILDEPTNGLDPSGIEGLRRLIRELADRLDATVFVSSHNLGEIEQIADHVGILHEGRLVLQGPLAPMRAGGRSLEQVFFDATRNTTAVIR